MGGPRLRYQDVDPKLGSACMPACFSRETTQGAGDTGNRAKESNPILSTSQKRFKSPLRTCG